MKIGLISFHDALNYGASLQAYSLQKYLIELGHNSVYINYINPRRKIAYNSFSQAVLEIKKKNILRSIKLIIGSPLLELRRYRFNQFYKKNLIVTKKKYHSSDDLKDIENKYDRFIVGSDQVWNIDNNGGDTAYLLDFVSDPSKKISYSSSFGMPEIPYAYQKKYEKHLKSITYLSTREKIGVSIIRQLCDREAALVLDPVFLLDKKSWESLIDLKNDCSSPYVFYYTNSNNQNNLLNKVLKCKEKYQKKHILSTHLGIREMLDQNISIKSCISPNDFLKEIKNSELVVTASFHCLAFAIIFRKQFVVILTGDKGKDERLNNLLQITGLNSRVYSRTMTLEQIEQPIDYDKVFSLLQPYIDSSKKFLGNALKETTTI